MNHTTKQTIIVIFSFIFVATMALILITSDATASTDIKIDAIITLPDATIPDNYLEPMAQPETTISDIDRLKTFLASDKTSDNPYIASGADNYVCGQYSVDLANNLSDAGFNAGVVVRSAKYHNKGSGHIMVWTSFNDSLFVIEPQNDQTFNPDTFNNSIDGEIYVLRYESIESGIKKASEEYKRRI